MKRLMSTLVVIAPLFAVSPAFAVDKSISALCDGSDTGYNRAGGYCEQIASNKPLGSASGGPAMCPSGYEFNYSPPPTCAPV